jgi:ElaB/YqjD/DUF883 family membrane-anchored ribosome-binding protein
MDKLLDQVAKDQLVEDFKVVIADAEALLRATAKNGGVELGELRAKIEDSLRVAKDRLAETQADFLLKSREAVTATDAYVHAKPWQSIGVAAGLGLIIGLLSHRR